MGVSRCLPGPSLRRLQFGSCSGTGSEVGPVGVVRRAAVGLLARRPWVPTWAASSSCSWSRVRQHRRFSGRWLHWLVSRSSSRCRRAACRSWSSVRCTKAKRLVCGPEWASEGCSGIPPAGAHSSALGWWRFPRPPMVPPSSDARVGAARRCLSHCPTASVSLTPHASRTARKAFACPGPDLPAAYVVADGRCGDAEVLRQGPDR